MDLIQLDLVTFEYLYAQSCNDIVQERFFPELKYEISLKLSALHVYEVAMLNGLIIKDKNGIISNGYNYKVNLKQIDKEFTLRPFIPYTLMESMKTKELFKLLNHYVKENLNNLNPNPLIGSTNVSTVKESKKENKKESKKDKVKECNQQLSPIDCKIHYLLILSQLPSFGAQIFPMNHVGTNRDSIESGLLVSRKYGISHVTNSNVSIAPGIKSAHGPVLLARIEDVTTISITSMDETSSNVYVEVHLKNKKLDTMNQSTNDQSNKSESRQRNPDGDQEETAAMDPNVTPILRFSLDEKDANQLVLTIQGYHRLLLTTPGPPSGLFAGQPSVGIIEQVPIEDYKEIPVFWDLNDSWTSVPNVMRNSYNDGTFHHLITYYSNCPFPAHFP